MPANPKILKPVGVQIIPDEVHQRALRRHLEQTLLAIATDGPQATAKLPTPPPQFVPVVEDAGGNKFVLSDPSRDHLAVQEQLKESDGQLRELLASRGKDSDDEWSQSFFSKLRETAQKRVELLNQAKPAARPVARPFKPTYEADVSPDLLEIGGFLKNDKLPPMPGTDGNGWAQQLLSELPQHLPLGTKNRVWQEKSAALRELADLKKRREDDEWRQDHFSKVHEAATKRNPTYESGNAKPRGGGFFAKDKSWSQDERGEFDEYHVAHFNADRKRCEQQRTAQAALKTAVPADLFAPAADPLKPDGTAEFVATPHILGELRERLLIAAKSQDAVAFQAGMQQMLQDKLATLNDRDKLLAALCRADAMREPGTSANAETDGSGAEGSGAEGPA